MGKSPPLETIWLMAGARPKLNPIIFIYFKISIKKSIKDFIYFHLHAKLMKNSENFTCNKVQKIADLSYIILPPVEGT